MNDNTLTIPLASDFIMQWNQDENERETLLNDLLHSNNNFLELIQYYQTDRWRVKQIGNIDVQTDDEHINGWLIACYGIELYNGCNGSGTYGDQTSNGLQNTTIDFQYEVNLNDGYIFIEGDEIRERSTLEEF